LTLNSESQPEDTVDTLSPLVSTRELRSRHHFDRLPQLSSLPRAGASLRSVRSLPHETCCAFDHAAPRPSLSDSAVQSVNAAVVSMVRLASVARDSPKFASRFRRACSARQ